jgi:ComF family protein
VGGIRAAFLRDIVPGLESLLFPSRCRVCGADLDDGARLLCPACRSELTASLPPDWRRACALEGGDGPRFASRPYDGPAGEAVRLLKFRGKRRLAPLLAEAAGPLAGALKGAYGLDTLVPVPLHPRRRRERGFNQAEEIGARVAAEAGLAFRRRGLNRTKYTTPQLGLTGEKRQSNVRGAFAAREDFSGRGVLLLDDVITTGATVRECAAVLRNAGAGEIVALAVAGTRL